MNLICEGCGRHVESSESYYAEHEGDISCKECDGSLVTLDTEYSCDECEEDFKIDELIIFSCGMICKNCVGAKFKTKVQAKIEYVDRIVEKPIIKYVSSDGSQVDAPKIQINNHTRFD